ncbi:hypothetical protein EON64_12855, partial [archaeon]
MITPETEERKIDAILNMVREAARVEDGQTEAFMPFEAIDSFNQKRRRESLSAYVHEPFNLDGPINRISSVDTVTEGVVRARSSLGSFAKENHNYSQRSEPFYKIPADLLHEHKKGGSWCCGISNVVKPNEYETLSLPAKSSTHRNLALLKNLELSLDQFKSKGTLFREVTGYKAMLVHHTPTDSYWCLKSFPREFAKEYGQQQELCEDIAEREKDALLALSHPFIVSIAGSFQDVVNSYVLQEFLPGGELSLHLSQLRYFDNKTTKFYMAQVILALDYMHSEGYMYRMLKPESIYLQVGAIPPLLPTIQMIFNSTFSCYPFALTQASGYLKLGDFSLCKKISDKTYTVAVGSAAYTSPELLRNEGYGKGTDWWALGILIFELLTGGTPFYHDNEATMFAYILKGKYTWPEDVMADGDIDESVQDIVKNLLQQQVGRRLGCKAQGTAEITGHKWLRNFPWETLACRQLLRSPLSCSLLVQRGQVVDQDRDRHTVVLRMRYAYHQQALPPTIQVPEPHELAAQTCRLCAISLDKLGREVHLPPLGALVPTKLGLCAAQHDLPHAARVGEEGGEQD